MQIWSWLLAAIGITGIYLAGSRRTIGWTIGVAAQALWITYALVTEQWGFIASALVYAAVYARNWAKWTREQRGDTQPASDPQPAIEHLAAAHRLLAHAIDGWSRSLHIGHNHPGPIHTCPVGACRDLRAAAATAAEMRQRADVDATDSRTRLCTGCGAELGSHAYTWCDGPLQEPTR